MSYENYIQLLADNIKLRNEYKAKIENNDFYSMYYMLKLQEVEEHIKILNLVILIFTRRKENKNE